MMVPWDMVDNYDWSTRDDLIAKSYRTAKVLYLRIPMSFDTETTSLFEYEGKVISTQDWLHLSADEQSKYTKRCICYIWMFNIGAEITFYGRHLEDFPTFLERLHNCFDKRVRFIIYIHNMSFDFAYIKEYFQWNKEELTEKKHGRVDKQTAFLTMDNKNVYQACTKDKRNVFKCSYILSRKPLGGKDSITEEIKPQLQHISELLQTDCTNIGKRVGDLDYTKIRTPETSLTDEELGYCEQDVMTLSAYIATQIEQFGDIRKIVHTDTGRVREDCKLNCLGRSAKYRTKEQQAYYRLMHNQLNMSFPERVLAKEAFQGGYVHAAPAHCRKVLRNIASVDLASAYPANLVLRPMPMSAGQLHMNLSKMEYFQIIQERLMIMRVNIKGLRLKNPKYPGLIIYNPQKNGTIVNPVLDNGRLRSADSLTISCTNIDWFYYRQFYDMDDWQIVLGYSYEAKTLPKLFIETVLDYYGKKTSLKKVKGMEQTYMHSKNKLNSTYGMTVTDTMKSRNDFIPDEEGEGGIWTSGDGETITPERVDEENDKETRFTFYPWGVFITAYTRSIIWDMILKVGEDYVYSDTDSIKLMNYDKHKQIFDDFNNGIKEMLKQASEKTGIPIEQYVPKDPKGEPHYIGVFEFEGVYDEFKTLGAKRYMVKEDGQYHITVSGLPKEGGNKWINSQLNPMDVFDTNMNVPWNAIHKLLHTYIESEWVGYVTDYTGHTEKVTSKGGVHLVNVGFNMSMTDEHIHLITDLQEI